MSIFTVFQQNPSQVLFSFRIMVFCAGIDLATFRSFKSPSFPPREGWGHDLFYEREMDYRSFILRPRQRSPARCAPRLASCLRRSEEPRSDRLWSDLRSLDVPTEKQPGMADAGRSRSGRARGDCRGRHQAMRWNRPNRRTAPRRVVRLACRETG